MRSRKQTERQQLLMESSLSYPRGKEGNSKTQWEKRKRKEEKTLGYLGVVNPVTSREDVPLMGFQWRENIHRSCPSLHPYMAHPLTLQFFKDFFCWNIEQFSAGDNSLGGIQRRILRDSYWNSRKCFEFHYLLRLLPRLDFDQQVARSKLFSGFYLTDSFGLEGSGGLITAGESSKSSDMLYSNASSSDKEDELISASVSDSRDCRSIFSNGGRTAIGKISMSTEVGVVVGKGFNVD
ncbi:hypothetical protein AVEN_252369-1 [Araneus ventricosus]|uniref:Uncharacterized protein n=1 Tax=Araneus ventricosus TaxID=182803 RepID=A0A4Y2AQP9_ARAVE|nr:hypothetical protein AVEN_252369-1 [Araneus ventricosus]